MRGNLRVLLLKQPVQEGRANEDGAVSTDYDADHHREREGVNTRAAEAVQNDRREQSRNGRQNSTAQHLIRRFVNDFLRQSFRLAANFAHTVEQNDRVVQGVPDKGQERGDGRQTNFELIDAKEGKTGGEPVAQPDESKDETYVVDQTDDGGKTKDRALESEP